MAFYFALFNVSNANHEARDKTQQQHVITSYAQSVECGAPAQHASRLDTSATRVMRKISQRRHSVANDSRLASRSAKIQSSSTPRRCSSPISQAKPSPTTSILSHHNAERDLTRRWTRVEERRRNNNNGNSKNNSSKNNSNNTLSTASTLSSHSSLASCTLRSSSSSGANVGAGDATQTSLSISTEGTPTAIAETVSVASALPVTATYWQAKRESLKRILRRNSAAASFARRKQRIDQENALTEKTVLKGALIKSPAIASSALPKRVKFMAGSLSSSVISSPMASLCFLSHNDSDKLLPSLPFSSSQLSSSALKKYRVRTAFPPPRKSLKPQNHTRKLSADDISFFKHTDLKEWNVRAVILPSRNRKTNNNNGELIEIVSGRHQRQQPSILEPNNNNVNNKALKTRESSDTNTVLSICDGNYCMPMQLDNGKRCANKITVRRTRSSRTAVEPIQNLGEKPRNDKHRRLHRCHSEKDQTESPAITLTTGSSVQERILLHRRRKCLAEWSSSANQREKQTCKTSLIRRRSTSDRRRQSSNTHAGYRRVDDKENLLAKISENNRLFSRFKNLFVDDGTANFGINDGLKHVLEEGDVPRRMSIRRHFSAITRSAISTPTTVKHVFVVSAKRTPFGAYGGKLSGWSPAAMGAVATSAALRDANLAGTDVDHIVYGNVVQAGADAIYLARHIGLKAGVDQRTPAVTVNRLCGSGFEAVVQACQQIACGRSSIVVAGGAESMSQPAHVVRGVRFGLPFGKSLTFDDYLWQCFTDSAIDTAMGGTAENLAALYKVSRADADAYAQSSQEKWRQAYEDGCFSAEIEPLTVRAKQGKSDEIFDTDEHPRQTTLNKLGALPTVFRKDGVVTAGNASVLVLSSQYLQSCDVRLFDFSEGVCDGAASLVLADEATMCRHAGMTPLVRVVAWATVGCEPSIMGIGPVDAIRQLTALAGVPLTKIDLVEV